MDDGTFDDIIRKKVEEFSVPDFDAEALSQFQRQIASVDVSPWHVRFRSGLLVAGGFLSATVMMIIVWYILGSDKVVDDQTALLQSHAQLVKSLRNRIDALEARPLDTIYVTRIMGGSENTVVLIRKIENLESMIRQLREAVPNEAQTETPVAIAPDHTWPLRGIRLETSPDPTDNARTIIIKKTHASTTEFSPAIARDLERHYRQGIGIHLGVQGEASIGLYSVGAGRIDPAAGIAADLIVSPSLSVETGAKFMHRFYEVSGADLSDENRSFPGVNPSLGRLVISDVDSWIVELPINVKYRYPLSFRTNWIASAGYSGLFFTKQIFEHEYAVDGSSTTRLNESALFKKTSSYPGLINFSIGVSSQLRNKKIIETALYYQHGTGRIGMESADAGFIGLRTSYWFRLR